MSPARREAAEEPEEQGTGPPECQGTKGVCPRCGKPSGTSLFIGRANIYCRRCRVLFELSIRVVKEA